MECQAEASHGGTLARARPGDAHPHQATPRPRPGPSVLVRRNEAENARRLAKAWGRDTPRSTSHGAREHRHHEAGDLRIDERPHAPRQVVRAVRAVGPVVHLEAKRWERQQRKGSARDRAQAGGRSCFSPHPHMRCACSSRCHALSPTACPRHIGCNQVLSGWRTGMSSTCNAEDL